MRINNIYVLCDAARRSVFVRLNGVNLISKEQELLRSAGRLPNGAANNFIWVSSPLVFGEQSPDCGAKAILISLFNHLVLMASAEVGIK